MERVVLVLSHPPEVGLKIVLRPVLNESDQEDGNGSKSERSRRTSRFCAASEPPRR